MDDRLFLAGTSSSRPRLTADPGRARVDDFEGRLSGSASDSLTLPAKNSPVVLTARGDISGPLRLSGIWLNPSGGDDADADIQVQADLPLKIRPHREESADAAGLLLTSSKHQRLPKCARTCDHRITCECALKLHTQILEQCTQVLQVVVMKTSPIKISVALKS